ncbi:hypothetical protein KUW17_02060 [Leisingera aquaemixtae]|uniref:DUF6477 family protein n=1 Tax=Leisingera TaxID=191028 RepID=UPI001C961651|nr:MULTISPECIES: DUF6477 family protein [Leisingera]MBY6065507.1 hypothetical protein [Leisingera aquaemixtae]MCB4454275.1 DUF6477 family protein [Leisingera sp. McT4-56]
MQDVFTRLTLLRRPRILARAARLGARNYCRQRDLRRILGYGEVPKPAAAVMRLLELEDGLNTARRDGEAGYSLIRHVDVLIALAGEAGFLRARPNAKTAARADRRFAAAEGAAPCP